MAHISPLCGVKDVIVVSHSEALLGNLILVSVPPKVPAARPRLAEGFIHEAMHLNLSALEKIIPLVRPSELLHSPWRSTPRETGKSCVAYTCLAA
jgi:HEXXH motif-containing protein